jgi:hypothetical protein
MTQLDFEETNNQLTHQYHVRCLKLLKPILNPTQYQFMLWITNQKWDICWVKYKRKTEAEHRKWMYKNIKLWT